MSWRPRRGAGSYRSFNERFATAAVQSEMGDRRYGLAGVYVMAAWLMTGWSGDRPV